MIGAWFIGATGVGSATLGAGIGSGWLTCAKGDGAGGSP